MCIKGPNLRFGITNTLPNTTRGLISFLADHTLSYYLFVACVLMLCNGKCWTLVCSMVIWYTWRGWGWSLSITTTIAVAVAILITLQGSSSFLSRLRCWPTVWIYLLKVSHTLQVKLQVHEDCRDTIVNSSSLIIVQACSWISASDDTRCLE